MFYFIVAVIVVVLIAAYIGSANSSKNTKVPANPTQTCPSEFTEAQGMGSVVVPEETQVVKKPVTKKKPVKKSSKK